MVDIRDTLRQLAIQIRDEHKLGANTAKRVGSLLLALVDAGANIEELENIFLRKDQADGTPHTFTFGKEAKFGDFISMLQGGIINKFGDAELRRLILRESLSVPDIRFNRMTYFEGYNVISPGGGFLIKEVIDNGDGTYTITPDREEGEPVGQFIDDILTGYWHNFSDGVGEIKGFGKVQFRVSSVDYEAKTAVLTPKPDTNAVPKSQMRLAQTGNFTNEERQTYIVIDTRDGNSCITFFDHANTWDVEPAQEMSWLGKKKGRTVHGIPADNYSAVLRNIIMSGKIFQVDDITGEAFRVPLNKGAWVKDVKNAYYDEVTHNGSSWLCVNPAGTTSEPTDTNADWLKCVAKGDKGDTGTSITNCGDWHTGLHVPYMGMTKMYGRIFLCKKEGGTDNPPMWTITDKDGNRILQTQDGGKTYGYFLTGELNTAEYELLVENGKDGRDGKDHEWIFKHTTENVAPSTPGTSQVDDYVPSGWRDDAIGVSETLPYEWACARTKKDGVWSAYTPSALWAKWGFDGESVVMADFDNEMVNASLNSNGITTSAQSWITVVTMSYGAEKLALDSITCAPGTGLTCMTNKVTGEVTVAVAAGVALRDTNAVNITVRATKNGQQYTRNLVFTVAGVRGGANGADAVLYSIVPSVSSVKKDKSGNYSVPSVSCKRVKTVGGVITDTTDGELKYSLNGGTEISIANNVGVSSASFSQSLKFIYYVGGKVVDVETVPMLIDGGDGAKGDKGDTGGQGNDGQSITSGGQWRTPASPIPALTIVTMGNSSWLSKVATLNPPIGTTTTNDGRRILQTQDGGKTYGYILTGEVNTAEWEKLTEDGMVVYLVSTTSNIRVSNVGSLVPSAFKVYAKRNVGSTTLSYSDGYLAARGYSNGIWSSIAGPARSSELTVNASAGYSTFSVRCYQSQADASAWNDNFVAEQSIGVSYDGTVGRTGSEPRPRGFFGLGNSYVWNERYHDIILATFNDRVIQFMVRAYGATVTTAPTSIDGDANWEAAQYHKFIASDLALIRQIRADEIYTDDLIVRNVMARDKDKNVTCSIDGETGDVFLKGRVEATEGVFRNVASPNGAFKINEDGNVELIGKIRTSLNGTRIEINPETNSIKMYNQANKEVGDISFLTENWNGTTNYYPKLELSTYLGNTLSAEISAGMGTLSLMSKLSGVEYFCTLNPTRGLSFYENSVLKKEYLNK